MNIPMLQTVVFGIAILIIADVVSIRVTVEVGIETQPFAVRANGEITEIHNCDNVLESGPLMQCAALYCEKEVFGRLANKNFKNLLTTRETYSPDTNEIMVFGRILYKQTARENANLPFQCSLKGLELLSAEIHYENAT